MKYYIAENGQPAGPFEPNELLAHGLTVNSLVWCEGMEGWSSASQVPELAAMLSGQSISVGTPMGNAGTQLPQMPPMGNVDVQLPQVPPFNPQPTQPQAPYNPQPQTTGNRPYAQPQYGPGSNQPSNAMPKNWLTESIIATIVSLVCCGFNIIGLVTGIYSIYKANGVKSKFAKGDLTGANQDASTAKKWMIITLVIGVIWATVNAYRLLTNPAFQQQIMEQMGLLGQ